MESNYTLLFQKNKVIIIIIIILIIIINKRIQESCAVEYTYMCVALSCSLFGTSRSKMSKVLEAAYVYLVGPKSFV